MNRTTIYIIAEGHAEAVHPFKGNEPACTVLIARLLYWLGYHAFHASPHVFRLGSYGAFFRGDKLERAVTYHVRQPDCAGVVVLLDMDDDCPVQKARDLAARIQKVSGLSCPVAVVCAKCEYEAWFLASLESITGDIYEGDPETRRDAKGWLRKRYGYKQTRDQAVYTRKIDVAKACQLSRSFRRAKHALEEIVSAAEQGRPVVTPAGARA